MMEAQPAGALELFECLATDPFGRVHRGREWTSPHAHHDVLVRQYHDTWLASGLSARRHEVIRNLVHLGNLKAFAGCHVSPYGAPDLVWPYAAGRSLAQALRASDVQERPLGIDQVLFLVWALSHHLRHLQHAGLSTGILSPHRVWIGFDGWVQLLDVPAIDILQELLPGQPEARAEFAAYLDVPVPGQLGQDAFQLGALLFEMLTHRPLPRDAAPAAALATARLGLPAGEEIPASVRSLAERLLGISEPFTTLDDLERTLESSVFGDAFEPSTFGLAFSMQTLFREELAASELPPAPEADRAPAPPASSAPTAGRSGGPRPWKIALPLVATGILGVWLGARSLSSPGPAVAPATAAPVPPAPVMATPTPAPVPAPALKPEPAAPSALPPSPPAAAPAGEPPASRRHPVKLRVFVDESGRVRQVHLISGAEEGSERERAASSQAMAKTLPAQASRSWGEITVMVP